MHTKITCKNCSQEFYGHFCNNCGQSADTHRLNLHFLWHDIQYGLFHINARIIYTLKELFSRPGITVKEFIEGKRVKHYKPFSMLVVLATLYAVLYHQFHIHLVMFDIDYANTEIKTFNEWISNHYAFIIVLTIPIYTLGTYIFFKNQEYNIYELLILNTYKASQRLILQLVSFPLIYFFNDTPTAQYISIVLYLVANLFALWTNIQFFDRLSSSRVIYLSLLSHILFLSIYFIVFACVALLHHLK